MGTLAELVVKLTGDIGGFTGAMQSAQNVAKSAGGGISAALSGIGDGAKIAVGGAVAGIVAIAAAATGSIAAVNSWAGELDALGDVLGTSANDSAALAVAIKGVGGDTQAITGQMARMVGTLKDAKGGLGEGGKLMASMGIAFEDANGQLLPTTDILKNIANGFGGLPDGLAKTEALTTLFGKSGKDLGDTLGALANGGFDAAAKKAKALGLAIGDDGVNNSIEFNKGLASLQMTAQGLMVTLGNQLMPVITPLIQKFSELAVSVMPAVGDVIRGVVGTIKSVIALVRGEGDSGTVSDFVENVLGLSPQVTDTVVNIAFGIQQAIQGIVGTIKSVIALVRGEGDSGTVGDFVENVLGLSPQVTDTVVNIAFGIQQTFQDVIGWVQQNWPAIQSVVGDVLNGVRSIIETVLAPALAFVIEQAGKVVGWVKENWPLIRKTAETVFNAIQTVITTVFNAVRSVVETVWPIIQTVVETSINAVLGVIKTVMQIINGDWSGAWDTIKATFEGVWNGISAFLTGIWNAIKGTVLDGINAVIGFINNSFIDPINAAIRSINTALGTAIGQVQRLQSLAGSNGLLPDTVVTYSGAIGNATWTASDDESFGSKRSKGSEASRSISIVQNFYGPADKFKVEDGVLAGLRRAGIVPAI